jgi:hypothetical protein
VFFPLPLGEDAATDGEARAHSAKPKETSDAAGEGRKARQILRPSPYPLPEGG